MTFREWQLKRFQVDRDIERLEPLVAKADALRNRYVLANANDSRAQICLRVIEYGCNRNAGSPHELVLDGIADDSWEGGIRYRRQLTEARERDRALEQLRERVEADYAAALASAEAQVEAIRVSQRELDELHRNVEPLLKQAAEVKAELVRRGQQLQEQRSALMMFCHYGDIDLPMIGADVDTTAAN